MEKMWKLLITCMYFNLIINFNPFIAFILFIICRIPVDSIKNANTVNIDSLSTDDTLNSNNAWQHNTQTGTNFRKKRTRFQKIITLSLLQIY